MKRFLVFAGNNYYPSGGWNDFVEDADTLVEARLILEELVARRPHVTDWGHVVDVVVMEEVAWWGNCGWTGAAVHPEAKQ